MKIPTIFSQTIRVFKYLRKHKTKDMCVKLCFSHINAHAFQVETIAIFSKLLQKHVPIYTYDSREIKPAAFHINLIDP